MSVLVHGDICIPVKHRMGTIKYMMYTFNPTDYNPSDLVSSKTFGAPLIIFHPAVDRLPTIQDE